LEEERQAQEPNNRYRRKTQATPTPAASQTPSEFWRCPSCRAVLKKEASSMAMWAGRQTGASLGGSVTCGGCNSHFAFAAVYGGQFDLATVDVTCASCGVHLRGPREELAGHPCPSCGAVLR
jgi:predicted RNA-binding Zn-ribbon protein involved in translation (DUF1610 family)